MAILVTNETKLCVSGITGREGTFHTLNNKNYGTNVVSGVTPGKGGQDVEGIPVFNTFAKAVDETGANTAMVFVPPPFAADSILEAIDAEIPLIVCITEGIPVIDMVKVKRALTASKSRLIGPNCPGVITPGQFGPISRDFEPASARLTLTMSITGMPSVMHTISGISASIASLIASAAPGGGT